MRIVSKRSIKLDSPVPVYDLTVEEHHNFVLGNGATVHNSLKEARLPFQAVLPLRGKVMNALKDSKGKTLESEEIINILAAIGYDVKAADPYSKLTVGKIICLADPDPDGPFVGETKIRLRSTNDYLEKELPIQYLANINATGGPSFEVPIWTGKKETWAPATAELVANVDRLVSMEIGGHKYKVSEGHKFVIIRTSSTRGRELIEFPQNPDLAFIEAKDMRIGDRVYYPAHDSIRRDWSKQDKQTGLGFIAVNKLRVQELAEPVPVYCLNVPRYHHFVLPSGVISSNCHINSLLLTLFYKYLPELFDRGMVYVSAAPEFYAVHKNQLVTGDTLSAVQKKLKKIGATNVQVNHLKGWGEASANLMRVLAVDPKTRRLIKIKAVESQDRLDFVRVMNEDVEFRRNMLGLPNNAVETEDESPAAAKKRVRNQQKQGEAK